MTLLPLLIHDRAISIAGLGAKGSSGLAMGWMLVVMGVGSPLTGQLGGPRPASPQGRAVRGRSAGGGAVAGWDRAWSDDGPWGGQLGRRRRGRARPIASCAARRVGRAGRPGRCDWTGTAQRRHRQPAGAADRNARSLGGSVGAPYYLSAALVACSLAPAIWLARRARAVAGQPGDQGR